MRIAIYMLVVSAACSGCSRNSDSILESSAPGGASSTANEGAPPTITAMVDAPDPNWREMFEEAEQLANVPAIAVTSTDGKRVLVTVKNVGTTTLQYYSAGPEHVQLFQEIEVAGRWTQSNWDWCGTGKERFEIAPSESAELVVSFWKNEKRQRMLANFSEKGTNRSGLVVLACEPDK